MQTYSFVLTSTDSKWRFGFCRHDAKAQTAMVIITYLPWHDTFLKFLNVLGEIKRIAKDDFQPFLAEAYAKGVPEPGACLKLFYNSGLNVIRFGFVLKKFEAKFETDFYQYFFFFVYLEFHLPTAITVSVTEHSRES